MRVRSPLTLVLLAGALLTGCSPGAPAPATPQQEPTTLVGLWSVSARGERQDTLLGIQGAGKFGRLDLWHACGRSSGFWQADPTGLFLGGINAGNGPYPGAPRTAPCPDSMIEPPWLVRATAYRTDEVDRLLLDVDGEVVARLTPASKDESPAAWSVEAPPPLTDIERDNVHRAAPPLPDGYRPATHESMLGRWMPVRPAADFEIDPHADVTADGSWRGHDGCHRVGGRWNAGPDGTVLAYVGDGTLLPCRHGDKAVGLIPHDTRRAGFDGTDLVLFDGEGREVSRLRRA